MCGGDHRTRPVQTPNCALNRTRRHPHNANRSPNAVHGATSAMRAHHGHILQMQAQGLAQKPARSALRRPQPFQPCHPRCPLRGANSRKGGARQRQEHHGKRCRLLQQCRARQRAADGCVAGTSLSRQMPHTVLTSQNCAGTDFHSAMQKLMTPLAPASAPQGLLRRMRSC